MKLTEVRIGNSIKRRNGKIGKVELYDLSLLEHWNIDKYHKNPPISPIPITEEILLKCGFEKIENNWKILSHFDVFYISWERLAGTAFSISNESIYIPQIQYLHQLQNLYFALTGEELEINL